MLWHFKKVFGQIRKVLGQCKVLGLVMKVLEQFRKMFGQIRKVLGMYRPTPESSCVV